MYDITIDFKDGRTQFYAGERVHPSNFSAEQVENFVRCGWMAPAGKDAAPLPTATDAKMDIQSVKSGTKTADLTVKGA